MRVYLTKALTGRRFLRLINKRQNVVRRTHEMIFLLPFFGAIKNKFKLIILVLLVFLFLKYIKLKTKYPI